MSFVISIILQCLVQNRVKFFHKNLKKLYITNMKLAFENVSFRHNSSCVMIKKWLKFKLVITARLAYLINLS